MIAVTLAGCSSEGVNAGSPGGGGGKGGKKGFGAGDVPVTVATVSERTVPVEVNVIGNVEAYSTISVKAQVAGELTKVFFKEGDFVKKGDPLFTIDPRSFQAALDSATASVAKTTAALAQAKANLAKDKASLRYQQATAARYAELFKGGIISKDQAEQLSATADATTQSVAADEAAIQSASADLASAKAAVESAQVQLSYTNIPSPIDGRTGNLSVKLGNVVPANTVELITITEVEPIYVTFSVPEAQLGDIKRYMAMHSLEVRAKTQDESAAEETGALTFVDNSVDATTGTIKLKGTFQNRDRKLWPGQFVRVSLRLSMRTNAIVVPNQAIQTGQNGTFVYVVRPNRTVEVRPVTASLRVDQDMVIDSGLESGETVVTEGQLRLAPDSRVVVRDGRGGPAGRGGRGRGPGNAGGGAQKGPQT
ncbi:MAG TPA: efflux RND transporter periplasmic adaptor subunit [Bryobacteraceae bacterium]|jgi:multidrug efflux system membrane fusion protein|nr:efflux RND transporter periplasmic adaptor subunit [Bryobacteraceae bacterium]